MAETLTEQHSYSLQTNEEQLESRCVYYVKLTDSCVKAIDEHISYHKNAARKRPIIKFNGQNGLITIPTKPGSSNQDVDKKFSFRISSLNTNPTTPLQGIVECLKHENKKSDNIVSFGALDSKISIAATEDVYENTRNRMAQVDQERKDVRTKEIKIASSTKQGKKAKAKLVTPSDNYKMSTIKKKILPTHHNTSSNKTNLLTTHHTNSPKTVTPTVHYTSSPASTTSRSSPVTTNKSFSCRERVIHVLALRPYKKPELISRLQREAMSQKDRNNLAMVLQQVATLSENQYKIQPNLFSEVNVDSWPFYNESERLTVKRNIATHKKTIDTSSPQLVSSTSKSPEEKPGIKRPISSHVDSSSKRIKPDTHIKHEEPSSTSFLNKKKHSPQKLKERDKPIRHEQESPPTVASTSDTPEHLVTYKPITTYEQRCQYKRDFQTEYPEYIALKKNVDAVTTKFIELDRSWRRTEKGSMEYEKLQNEIVEAYNKQQKDEKFHEMKHRCQELHQKLFHIKRLVVEYDNVDKKQQLEKQINKDEDVE